MDSLILSGSATMCTEYVYFQNNTGLLVLNLAWNGFHTPGGNALAKALGKNTTLEELDIASNRIDDELLGTLATGLKKNSTLKILKVTCTDRTSFGSKKEGKDQESIQSSTTPDPG